MGVFALFATFSFLLFVGLSDLVVAQDGGISGPTTSPAASGYQCDPNRCKLPSCNCASASPPGGLDPSEVPQFVVFTADDAIQSYTLDAINQLLAQRMNPNGCPIKMTYFTSISYTNYTLVTDWYVAGNEIADHTMTHVGSPPASEIDGNLIALNTLAGIPLSAIKGFRAPYLNYTNATFHLLADANFTYDSSVTSSIPVTDPDTDAYWPYTLDYGLANDCLTTPNICKGQPQIPGFWEIPMYAFFDDLGEDGPHLMDPWLDAADGDSTVNNTATLDYMKNTFTAHYNGNKQPIGLYTHPIHISLTYPGSDASTANINMINEFLDWVQEQRDVWIVSNEQLLAWVQNPVPISQLDSFDALKCKTPDVDSSVQICNGIPANEAGLLQECSFPDYPFFTCYGCPQSEPSPSNPNPPQQVATGQQARLRLPANCSTPFWDPIAGECLCTSTACQYTDQSLPIGPNGANLTGGNPSETYQSMPTLVLFNGVPGDFAVRASGISGLVSTLILGIVGAAAGRAVLNL
ncbi:hypothetical protein M404DRAFT_137803 [Pisolithus tinctorius Marx 270]|uniref:Chitin deacetylase n=1 Tax=Pisolithus tinctorius Marx 270 TaxID=870435 RepID=A0A0C3P217_PISTI|nr:hypothetical protein M404DRAFT_137803 [Pisolithus tinctorius Marx 270]